MFLKHPLLRQCFVTSGVTVNYMTHGFVVGYTSVLLPALRGSSEIPVDESSLSWIASVFGISLIFGALTVPSVMDSFGRKPCNIFSAALMAVGWIVIVLSTSTTTLLIGRILQGYSMGFLAILGSVLIGEYCSPDYRGALLATISFFIIIGVLITHALGTFISWQILGLIFAVISFLNLLIIIYSPESPSFLVSRGRYDECRRTFNWLRGSDDADELEKLIRTDMSKKVNVTKDTDRSILNLIVTTLSNFKLTFSKKEVFKPILIAMHLYGMNQWAGGITLDSYTKDIVDVVVGKEVNFAIVIVSLDVQRTLSVIIGVITVKKFPRKTVLWMGFCLNLFGYLSIASYVYLKTNNMAAFDHPLIGIILLHVHMFSNLSAITLSNIIPGEIFPMEHRGLCAMTGLLFFSLNETINIKSAPYLLSSLGLHGAYFVYACLLVYFFSVAWIMLPETKDRTLLNIEEEFKGEPLISEDNRDDDLKMI